MSIGGIGREVQEHTLGNRVYKIQQLGSTDARRVFLRVLKALGPAVAAAGGKGDDEATAAAIGTLCEKLSDADLDYLVTTFAKVTRVSPTDNPNVEFVLGNIVEEEFAGKMGRMLGWLWACLKTNYATFLDDLPAEVRSGLMVLMTRTETSTPAPTGQSGASLLRGGPAVQ